jgi:hypothetical protein
VNDATSQPPQLGGGQACVAALSCGTREAIEIENPFAGDGIGKNAIGVVIRPQHRLMYELDVGGRQVAVAHGR